MCRCGHRRRVQAGLQRAVARGVTQVKLDLVVAISFVTLSRQLQKRSGGFNYSQHCNGWHGGQERPQAAPERGWRPQTKEARAAGPARRRRNNPQNARARRGKRSGRNSANGNARPTLQLYSKVVSLRNQPEPLETQRAGFGPLTLETSPSFLFSPLKSH